MLEEYLLGVHEPAWLPRPPAGAGLFVSRRRLMRRVSLPVAAGPWALDSGAFTELDLYRGWTVSAYDYATEVRRYSECVGRMKWASIQDWMCEPWILGKTGLTVAGHIDRTVRSYTELMTIAPDVPWAPVLQGWDLRDYVSCVEAYGREGVDLTSLPIVGVGSVCRRQATREAVSILKELSSYGIRLHGFGFKLKGVRLAREFLVSADSLAWSYDARRAPPIAGHMHKNCANCAEYAANWYTGKVLPLLS